MSTSEILTDSALESSKFVGDNKSKFAREHGISNSGLRWRLNNNWPAERLTQETRKPIDYDSFIGRHFGSVIVEKIWQDGTTVSGNKRMVTKCRCEKCGHEFTVLLGSLISKKPVKEHCPQCWKETRRSTFTRERKARDSMIQRCYNPNCCSFENYGKRGITVCDKWLDSFDNFIADMGPCPPGYSLDRIDVNGNYEPSNCRWADNKTQCNNRRTNHNLVYRGIEMTSTQWGNVLGVQPQRIRAFIKRHNNDISAFIDYYAKIQPSILLKIQELEQI